MVVSGTVLKSRMPRKSTGRSPSLRANPEHVGRGIPVKFNSCHTRREKPQESSGNSISFVFSRHCSGATANEQGISGGSVSEAVVSVSNTSSK